MLWIFSPQSSTAQRRLSFFACVVLLSLLLATGCSRRFWRRQAERDTYDAILRKLNDPHWAVPRTDLNADPRSRFYDPWDPDCEPLPPDDPAAHESMHFVSGRRGYKNWHKLGTAPSIENPHWLNSMGIRMDNTDPVLGHSQVSLADVTLQDAVELTYIHSREYQTAIEDLYLTALAVTQQEYFLGIRYAGPGVPVPGFTGTLSDDANGRETIGWNPSIGLTQLLPAGTQLAVELANNTLWLFGGGTSSSGTSLAYSLTQPLLFRAGRKVVLEALTQADRNVLYAARDLARFRQILFAGVTSDFLLIQRQLQAIRNLETNIRQLEDQISIRQATDSFRPTGVSSDLRTFPERAQIPESIQGRLSYDDLRHTLDWIGDITPADQEAIVSVSDDPDYQSAAAQLIRMREIEITTLSSAQLQTNLNQSRNQMEDASRRLADLTDLFKVSLGLPPNIGMTLDNSLLDQFTLIDPTLVDLDQRFRDLQEERGVSVIPSEDETPSSDELLDAIRRYLTSLKELRDQLGGVLHDVEAEFGPVRDILNSSADAVSVRGASKRRFFSEEERQRVLGDIERDEKLFDLNERDFVAWSALMEMLIEVTARENFPRSLDENGDGLVGANELPDSWIQLRPNSSRDDVDRTFYEVVLEAASGVQELRENMQKTVQSLTVVQADLRVEIIGVNAFHFPGHDVAPDIEEVVRIGLARRHDLMNARAQVMDARRRIEVAANALEATLDVTFNGTVGTRPTSRKPFDFSGDTGQPNAGLAIDSPADKIAERNAYNAALIDYQRARRDYMALEDLVKQQIRESWRQLQVSEQKLEIDRQAVRVAALQYDIAAIDATGPGQNNALNLLNALDAVLDAQNFLMSDWITYEISRLNIYRDMGIMEIDRRGLWTDSFYLQSDEGFTSALDCPPADLLLNEDVRESDELPVLDLGPSPDIIQPGIEPELDVP